MKDIIAGARDIVEFITKNIILSSLEVMNYFQDLKSFQKLTRFGAIFRFFLLILIEGVVVWFQIFCWAPKKTENLETDQNFAIGTEIKLKEQAVLLETLSAENEKLKQNHSDLIDELLVKKKEVQDLEENYEKTKLRNSSNSLKDELQDIEMFKCETSSLSFLTPTELREHMKTLHSQKLNRRLVAMTNLNKLEVKLSEQKMSVTSSLFELKNKEDYERHN